MLDTSKDTANGAEVITLTRTRFGRMKPNTVSDLQETATKIAAALLASGMAQHTQPANIGSNIVNISVISARTNTATTATTATKGDSA